MSLVTAGRAAEERGEGPATCHIEFLGPARLLISVREVTIEIGPEATLGELVLALAERYPALAGRVLDLERRMPVNGYIFNRNGRDFLAEPDSAVRPGDRLLLLASAAGG